MPEGIGSLLFQTAEKAAEKSPLAQETAQGLINFTNHFFTLDSKLTGEGGGMIKNMLKSFEDQKDYHLARYTKAAQNHVAAGGKAPEPHEIMSKAVSEARSNIFGPKHQALVLALKKVRQEHGVFGDAKAAEIADHLSAFFHDQKYDLTNKQGTKIGETSKLTSDLTRYKTLQTVPFKVSEFKSPKVIERGLRNIGSGAFAYKAGLAHSTQGFINSLFNARASSMIKAVGELFSGGYDSAKSQLIASNAIGDVLYREYAQVFNYHGSAISKFLPDTVGEFIHRNYMIPGISAARNINSVYAGLVGKYDALYAAHAITKGGRFEQRGAQTLERLGLNWRAIQQRNGQLTKAELEQSMRYMIDNVMFRGRDAFKTKISAQTPVGRLFTIFHSYTNMQSRLLVESTKRNLFQLHDPAMFLQQLTALAVVMPTVGNAIYSIDQAWTGKNEHPIDNFVGREKAIYSAHEAGQMFDAIAHMGGFGFAYGSLRAAGKQRLANYFLGAPVSAIFEAGGDAIKGIHNTEDHPHQADQFYRDILHDVPSMGLGGYIANKELPTRSQRDAQRPMTVRRIKAAMHHRKRKSN